MAMLIYRSRSLPQPGNGSFRNVQSGRLPSAVGPIIIPQSAGISAQMPVFAKIDYTATGSLNPPIRGTMDSPRIGADVSGKLHMGFTFFVLCLCVIAVILGSIDLSTGHHRLNAGKRLRRIGLLPRQPSMAEPLMVNYWRTLVDGGHSQLFHQISLSRLTRDSPYDNDFRASRASTRSIRIKHHLLQHSDRQS